MHEYAFLLIWRLNTTGRGLNSSTPCCLSVFPTLAMVQESEGWEIQPRVGKEEERQSVAIRS
jgi:hypothetical protein